MKKSEKEALRLYPVEWITVGGNTIDKNAQERAAFIKGYEQANKNSFVPKWYVVDDFSDFNEESRYDRVIIAEDGGCVVLYDKENEMAIEIGDLLDSLQDDDEIDFVRVKQQCPFRDENCKFCKEKYNDIMMYAQDCPPHMCICDGKCDWMTKHDMDKMKKSYDEI